MSEPTKKGDELFEEVGADPTLDLAMDKDPRDVSREDLEALVTSLRRERAFNIRLKEKK